MKCLLYQGKILEKDEIRVNQKTIIDIDNLCRGIETKYEEIIEDKLIYEWEEENGI